MSHTASSDRQIVPLGHVAEFRNGVNFVAAQRGAGIPVLNVKDFQDRFQPDYADLEQLIPTAVRRESLLRAGDILFVRSNGNKELIGRSMYLRTEPPRPTTHSAFTIRMRVTSPKVEPQYCAYFIRGGIVRGILSAQGSGTNISNLNQDILSRLEIWLPPLDIQLRIAGILSLYDDLIDVNAHRITILEEMTRRLFNEWITKQLGRLPLLGDRLDEWTLPQEWKFRRLIDLATIVMGQSPPSETYNSERQGLPLHQGVTDFEGFFHRNRLFVDGALRPRIAETGDILFSVRAPVARITLALNRMVLGRGLAAIRPAPAIKNFIFCHLRATFPHVDMIGNGAIYRAVTKDDVHGIPIIWPTDKIVEEFERHSAAIWSEIKTLYLSNVSLRAARDLLLPKLISGEIDLSGAEREVERAADQAAAE